jgi:hypothetical protein
MDRGYVHMARLVRFCHAGAFFVVRSKYQLQYRVVSAIPAPPATPALYAPTWWWPLSRKDSRWRGQCTPSCRSSACPCSRSSR